MRWPASQRLRVAHSLHFSSVLINPSRRNFEKLDTNRRLNPEIVQTVQLLRCVGTSEGATTTLYRNVA